MPPGVILIISTLVPISFFALIFGIFYIRNRENMALIDRGINPRKNYGGARPFVNLKYGLLLVGSGMGLLTAYLLDVLALSHINQGSFHSGDNPAIYFSLIAIGGGAGLVLSYLVEKKHGLDKQKEE